MGLGSVYIGMSGMLAFSRALDLISNNVANLNTPGFKLSELEFQDLFYTQTGLRPDGGGEAALALGSGVAAPSTTTRFSQGELRETGNSSDLAIDGNGFFVLREDGRTLYTRAGQFEFSDDGFLVSTGDESRVAAVDAHGRLVDLSLGDLRISRPRATATVELVDNLSTGSTGQSVTGVQVVDALGESHSLTLVFDKTGVTEPRAWHVAVRDASGNPIADAGEVRFGGDGSPLEGWNQAHFSFAPDGAPSSDVTIDLGRPGGFDGATSFSAGSSSTLRFGSQDGFAEGSIVGSHFDDDGVLQIDYSNGQSASGPRLALAWFDDLQALEQLGAGTFRAPDSIEAQIGPAHAGVMGRIRGGTIEISNVELTQQFTDLIVVQRGFQASSQVLTTANEMLQELLDGTRPRR